MTTISTLSTLSTAPTREMTSSAFAAAADVFLPELNTLQTELNTSIGQINTVSGEINSNSSAAASSADIAVAAAAATIYAAGTTYAAGDIVFDPGNDYIAYTSQQGSNTGHTPNSDDGTWWEVTLDVAVMLGKHTIWIPAGSMEPRITNSASYNTVETTTNKIMIATYDFDPSTDEFTQFSVKMPESWDAGTVTAQFVWSHAATDTNFGVRFFIQGVAFVDDDAADTAFGTAVGHTADTGGTTDDIYVTYETSAITISNTPAKSDLVIFQIYRDVSDAGDTLAVDARLHGVSILYTIDAHTDS